MAWNKSKGVGNYGSQMRITVQLISQNQAGNTSVIRVIGDLYNGSPSGRAFNLNGTPWSISGGVSKPSANFTFDISGRKWGRVGSQDFTVSHDSAGNKSLTVTLTVGATGTSTFGTPGSVSVSFTLPRIPKAPSAPGVPTLTSITATSARASSTAPSNNGGAGVTAYEFQRATNSSFTAGVATVSSGSTAATLGSLAANTTYWVRARARNAAGWGGWSGSRPFTTTPTAPPAVSNGRITRVSDTAQDLAWNRNPSAAGPYQTIQIERRDTVAESWVRLPDLAGTATSYRDQSTVAGRRYDYRIRPANAGGAGAWSAVLSVNTTPLVATDVGAVKDGTGISVSWVPGRTQWGIINFEIEDNPGGAGWTPVGTVGNVAAWRHANPNNAVTHQYRVRPVAYLYGATDPGRLYGPWSKPSGIVQLLAPPLAPTLLGPFGTLDYSLPVRFQWKHNPVDTTTQTAYELLWRYAGDIRWSPESGTSAQLVTLPAFGLAESVEWQVRTRGLHASFGPWSGVANLTLDEPPTVSLNAPTGADLLTSVVVAEWGYLQNTGSPQAFWRANLIDTATGDVVEARSGSGQTSSVTFQLVLEDSTEYAVTVEVTAGNGLSATDAVTFLTDFPSPVTVEPVPVFDRETGASVITFTDPPVPAQYAWTNTPDASPSTRTTDEGTVTNLETNPRFATNANIPAPLTRRLQPDGSYYLINPAPAARGYGHSPYGHSEYGY